MKRFKFIILVLTCVFCAAAVHADVPSPEEVLGFRVGEDRNVADMYQILDYFDKLDKTSNRIQVQEVGKTTLGNPFIVAVITSVRNHAKLEQYQAFQQLLADPRKIAEKKADKIIADGKAIVMINCSLHASEIGASQMAMQLAYDLATGNDPKTRHILDNVILILIPMHNPDGIQMVVDWYRKNLGTKYEGGRMPWLYHKYVGHDNNRDWYMFTQVESRLTLKVHNAWHPQIILDMHQMGNRGARIFVPPYVDPYEPNVDPILRQQVAMMGTFMASELTAEGKAGVMHSSMFDAWTPARAYHHYHGGIRILTELASVKVATPIKVRFEDLSFDAKKESVKMPLPWKGGKWTLQDIVEYDYSAAKAVLTNAASLRQNWLRNFYRIHKKAVQSREDPFAFLIPAEQRDLPSAVKMMNVLQLGGVEIHMALTPFSAEGKNYPAGTYVIFMAQPYGRFAKALLEKQDYPEIRQYPNGPLKTPYDVVAHTLPMLMGVDVIKVNKTIKLKARLMDTIQKPQGRMEAGNEPFGYIWGHVTNESFVALNRLLKNGYKVFWTKGATEIQGRSYPEGTMIAKNRKGLKEDLGRIIKDVYVHFKAIGSKPDVPVLKIKPVRLGLYKSWTASMDEGWTRWVLEQFEFPYQSVYDKDIREGDLLKKYDVLVLPDIREISIIEGLSESSAPLEYTGGIGDVGANNIRQFIRNGGCLITLNSSSDFAVNRLYLGVKNVVQGISRKEFFIPGSILKVLNNQAHPIAYGYCRDTHVFFRRSPVFSVNEGVSVARYLAKSFQSGWINGEELLVNRSAIVDVPYGKGRVILLGFPALYRGQAHGTFRYFFNAIFYGAAGFDFML